MTSAPSMEPPLYAEYRLRDYSSAHRAMGCGCGECPQCHAMYLMPNEADDIADVVADMVGRLRAAESALREISMLRLAEHMGPHHLGLTAVSIAKEYFDP